MQNGVTNMKKVFILILIILGIKNGCYAEEIKMDKKLQDGMNYYFEKLIPMYYKGQTFEKERNLLIRNCGVHMTGTNEDTIHTVKGTNDIVFNFYYIQDRVRQLVQTVMLTSESYNGEIYEYWIVKLSDNGTPYNYAYFYLTKCDSITSKRCIVGISTKYQELYELKSGKIFNLTINNLITLYKIAPWLKLESFKDTKYENMIVKWKKDIPYLRKMNIFEKIYYKNIKKSKR
jgi:hypothetical protein